MASFITRDEQEANLVASQLQIKGFNPTIHRFVGPEFEVMACYKGFVAIGLMATVD